MYPYNGYTVEGANLCVSPCGEESYEAANMFCEVILASYSELFEIIHNSQIIHYSVQCCTQKQHLSMLSSVRL